MYVCVCVCVYVFVGTAGAWGLCGYCSVTLPVSAGGSSHQDIKYATMLTIRTETAKAGQLGGPTKTKSAVQPYLSLR